MGRFGQPRYKDPLGMSHIVSPSNSTVGTPPALRGIREVTDKNKHILLDAIFGGEFIPDHLLPVGIHRCGQQRWRAHLCTVGHKFSGPPRENVREACEDRRKFCEENGVNFVLYGKQTHAKGPIGSRSVIPSAFPRLSDYVTSMSRGAANGASVGNGQMILSGLKSNSAMKPFFAAVENAKKILNARKSEQDGTASYALTPSHAALHKRIVEDVIDRPAHVYHQLRMPTSNFSRNAHFTLCPIKVHQGNVLVRFVWDIRRGVDDPALFTYLDSIVSNANPPLPDSEKAKFIRHLLDTDVSGQIRQFGLLSDKMNELIRQHGSLQKALQSNQLGSANTVATRKASHGAAHGASVDPTNPVVSVSLKPDVTIQWNCLTPDSLAEEYSRQLQNDLESVAASDMLHIILEHSVAQRINLFRVSSHSAPTKKGITQNQNDIGESHSNFSEDSLLTMRNDADMYSAIELEDCLKRISRCR